VPYSLEGYSPGSTSFTGGETGNRLGSESGSARQIVRKGKAASKRDPETRLTNPAKNLKKIEKASGALGGSLVKG